MPSKDKKTAKATVNLVTGNLVNYFDTLTEAESYAEDANRRAENMGIEARYQAHSL